MADASDAQIIRSHQAQVRQVRERVLLFARTAWAALGSYRDADIDRLVSWVVPQVLAGERRIAQLTDAYLSTLVGMPPVGVDPTAVSGIALRGVDPREVYQRPGKSVWIALANGATVTAAAQEGLARLLSIASTDLQLAKRVQEQQTLSTHGFRYYRRVLTGTENCALCIVASTQRYRVGSLNPVHPGCDCDVAQVTAASDPGQVLNGELLDALHEQVGLAFGTNDRGARIITDQATGHQLDYKDILVRHHGEYGPTLTWRKQRFTGPRNLAA